MKRFVFVIIVIAVLTTFSCSRPIQPTSDFILVKSGELVLPKYFDVVEKIIFEDAESIRLTEFIDSTITIYPQLYAYRIIGADGYYPALKGVPDNIWEQMSYGYLKIEIKKVVFDPILNLPGKYNVKDMETIQLLRKIDTKLASTDSSIFLLVDSLSGGQDTISLVRFIEPFTTTPQNYSYKLIGVDGTERLFSWAEIQTGRWVISQDLTRFNPDLGSSSHIFHLKMIELNQL